MSWFFFTAIGLCLVSCETDETDRPPRIVVANGLSSFVVESVEQNVRTIGVRVLDQDSLPKPGIKVYFRVKQGKAIFVDSIPVTDADGIASVKVRLGTQAGTVVISAQAEPLIQFPVYFNFKVTSSVPAVIEVLSGNNQEVLENTRLTEALVAIVRDRFGNPVPDGEVAFSISSGNGTLSRTTATLYNGAASVEFTTGKGQQISTVTASFGAMKTEFTVFNLLPVQLSPATHDPKNIQISWTKSPSPNFKSYSVYRSRKGFNDEVKLAEITDVDVTTFEDTAPSLGMIYSYYIRVDTKLLDHVNSAPVSGECGRVILSGSGDDADIALDTEHGLIYLTTYYSGKVLIVSASTFQKVDSIMLNEIPRSIALSNDFSKLYVAYAGLRTFDIFRVPTGSRLKTVDLSQTLDEPISDLYVASNNDLFAVGDWILKINEANNYAQQKVGDLTDAVFGLPRFVGDHDNYLYLEVSNYTPNSLFKLDMSQPSVPQVLEDDHGSIHGTTNCVLSPDGTRIYLTDQVINTSNFATAATFPETSYARAFSENGQKLYTTSTSRTYATSILKRLDVSTLATEEELVVGFLDSRMFVYNNALYVFTELQYPSGLWRFYKIDL